MRSHGTSRFTPMRTGFNAIEKKKMGTRVMVFCILATLIILGLERYTYKGGDSGKEGTPTGRKPIDVKPDRPGVQIKPEDYEDDGDTYSQKFEDLYDKDAKLPEDDDDGGALGFDGNDVVTIPNQDPILGDETKFIIEGEVSAKSIDESHSKPNEKPTAKPVEKPTQKPAEKPTQKPAEKPTEKPAEKSDGEPGEKSDEGADEGTDEKPAPPVAEGGSTLSAKEIQKLKEKAEKDKLEKFVLEEYEKELAGIESKVTARKTTPGVLQLPKPLLFLHIPKTAGSTLAQVFKNNNQPEKYYHFWNQPRLGDLHLVPSRDTIFGHFRYGLHYYFENRSVVSYATMLREPIDRVISYYHFHLQDPQDPAHEFATKHTFEEWLEVSEAAQNEMTKCLSGIRSEFMPSQTSFEMAKHHLNNMGYVGLTERFDDSLVLMKYYLGFDNIRFSNVKVGNKKPKAVSPQIIEKIRERNLMDIELYEMAKKRFEQELDEVAKFLLAKELKGETEE